MAKAKWGLEALQERLVQFIISCFGDELLFQREYLVAGIDTNLMPIFGKKMAGVQKWHDHSGNADRGGYIRGHHWGLIGFFVCRACQWICLPLTLIARIIFGQKAPAWVCGEKGVRKASFWDQALALCTDLARKVKHRPIFVADAYFTKDTFIVPRFYIETAIEQMKGPLGLPDYKCYNHIAVHRFVPLVCFAVSCWKVLSFFIPLSSWMEGFSHKPYIVQTQTSFGLFRQVVRQYTLRRLIFPKFTHHVKLRKNIKLHQQIIRFVS